jgi:serine protease Do
VPAADLPDRIVAAVERIAPSIALVETVRPARRRGGPPFDLPARATAVAIDRKGGLVTNQHVVEGATALRVRLADGRELTGEVVGGDAATDVALLRVEASDLSAATLGDSERLRVGQIVLAVGNALGLPGAPTVSMGVVSALGRPLPGADFVFEGLLQTDAAINPGNSGGPLVDLDGSVVGINAAVMPFAQGVGFAIPIHAVQRIAEELRRTGRISRPWMGVSLAELGPSVARAHGLEPGSGLLVAEVVPRSPAHRAGLKVGDVVTRLGPFEVRAVRDLLGALSNFPVDTEVDVAFRRRGQTLSASVPLRERPEEIPAEP